MLMPQIMLGVHGNGLTHLLWMPATPQSAVIEMYIKGGFARDCEYTWTVIKFEYGIHLPYLDLHMWSLALTAQTNGQHTLSVCAISASITI